MIARSARRIWRGLTRRQEQRLSKRPAPSCGATPTSPAGRRGMRARR